jgi:hypothetical protein
MRSGRGFVATANTEITNYRNGKFVKKVYNFEKWPFSYEYAYLGNKYEKLVGKLYVSEFGGNNRF